MIALYIVLGIIGAVILFYIIPTLIISNIIYTVLFVRTKKEKWGRTVSWDDEEQQRMFDEGKKWGDTNEKYRRTLKINSEGFNLVGEYFDFGSKKAVIIIPGRMESGTYSYYFSEPYRKSGFNVLAIDNRSHGLSDGRYNCLGLKEYEDILNWAKKLHDDEGVEKVIIHGLCIGSATGLYALTDENCPSYLAGLVADGMYIHFNETLKNNLKQRNKPIFPYLYEIMRMLTIVAHTNPKKKCPLNLIDKLNKPILFIYSEEDKSSLPANGQLLYDKCSAPKHLEWFPKGAHSHVRINNQEHYDETIEKFVAEHF